MIWGKPRKKKTRGTQDVNGIQVQELRGLKIRDLESRGSGTTINVPLLSWVVRLYTVLRIYNVIFLPGNFCKGCK